MLLPEYESPFIELTHDWIRELAAAQNPLLREITSKAVDHLPDEETPATTSVGTFHPMEPITAEFTLSFEDMLNTGLDEWLTAIYSASVKAGEQMVLGLLELMKNVCERTGNVVDAGGEPISHDQILDMIEKIDIEVDEDLQFKGRPCLVMSPEMVKRVEELGPMTPEQEERWKQIMTVKRERQNAQRRARKLD